MAGLRIQHPRRNRTVIVWAVADRVQPIRTRMCWALRTVAATYPARPRHRRSRDGGVRIDGLGAEEGKGLWLGRSSSAAVAVAGLGCRLSTTELDGMLA